MKIQLEQLDLLKPWPTFRMKPGYRAVCVMLRVGIVPLGEVLCRPVRKRLVTPGRLQRRIRRRKLALNLLKLLSTEMLRGRAILGRGTPSEATAANVPLSTARNAQLQDFAEDHLLRPEGVSEPYRAWILAAQSATPYACPAVTVVVCTADRPAILKGCLQSLSRLDYPNLRIMVVDNSRDPLPTRQVTQRFNVQYLRQPERGLSRARNSALESVETDWIAFTDDDCRPERQWLRELVRPLEDSNCRCVTGLVVPAQLENSAEITFEVYGGLGRGAAPAVFEPRFIRKARLRPATTWRIGAGANMLMHAGLAREVGGFDIDMGAGTPCGCGEDTLLYFQFLRRGHSIHYTPRSIVHHHHRGSAEALRHQIYHYAKGHAAYHVRCFVSFRDYRSLLHLGWHLPRWFVRNFKRGARNKTKYPHSLVLLEARGTLAGTLLYSSVKIRRGFSALSERWFKRPKKFSGSFVTDPIGGQEVIARAVVRSSAMKKIA
ncbi:MAG: glycosyltransferase [Chthoniobacterales bacterium]|nr:glycosyltransferase [Chthoniobacterales bacterium]